MKEILEISSLENENIKNWMKLKKRKHREEQKLFLAEGRKFLEYPERAKSLLAREDVCLEEDIRKRFSCPIYRLSKKCFEKISSQENSQGIILVYSRVEALLEECVEQVLVLDDVQDPGNVGTILRLADAAGFSDILLTENCADVYNEKVVRSSMGSIFHVRTHPMKKEEILAFLKEKNYAVTVTTLQEDSIPYTDLEVKGKNAFVFGNEGHGISEDFLALAFQKIIIPISGKAESLNVAMALGIIIFYLRDLKRLVK